MASFGRGEKVCGVLGFYSKDPRPAHLEAICNLFEQSKVRGLHAAGFSVWEPKELHRDGIRTVKAFNVEDIKKEIMKMRYSPPQILIGHTRYSTSGDWKDHTNNQPIHLGDGASLVFNGVIHQGKKEEYEKIYGRRYVTDNDGEIVLRKFLDEGHGVAARFVGKGKFSFAGAWLSKGEIYIARNEFRPLYEATFLDGKFFASTRDIFRRAGGFKNVTAVPTGTALLYGSAQ